MDPQITPEAVQADLGMRRPGARELEDTRGHSETGVGSDDLCAGHPLSQFTSFPRSETGSLLEVTAVLGVDLVGLLAGAVD